MKSKQLHEWLQEHAGMLGAIEDEQDQTFHATMYECLIDLTASGETRMLDSLLESAATRAVAVDRPLTNLLGVPQRLRERIWQRIGEEVDPEPAFAMLSLVDKIFVHIIRVAIDAYMEATRLAHAAKSAEISRLYTESEQKVMDYAAKVARANRELAKLDKAKTDFISIAAHELKTPLTLIQGYVNILHDADTTPRVKTLADGINRGAERMNGIVEDMLDLSAIDMNQLVLVLEQVNLSSLIDLAVDQLERTLTERRQTVELVDLEGLPHIEADASRLFQVFKHLFSNAIKYTPDNGRIIVSGVLLAATNAVPDSVQILVQDTGVGIAPEERDKIFEKFYRVGDSNLHSTSQTRFMGAGPGLGLAIVKGLVEAHGGRTWAESQGFDMGNYPGSAFYVVLPVQAAPREGVQVRRLLGQKSQPEKLTKR